MYTSTEGIYSLDDVGVIASITGQIYLTRLARSSVLRTSTYTISAGAHIFMGHLEKYNLP